jgi:hypothetical protein
MRGDGKADHTFQYERQCHHQILQSFDGLADYTVLNRMYGRQQRQRKKTTMSVMER